jgi:hypothetical protein
MDPAGSQALFRGLLQKNNKKTALGGGLERVWRVS